MTRVWAPRRFWTTVEVIPVDGGGWAISLDGRILRTPGKATLVLPTRAFAEIVAAEWATQDRIVKPQTMPATRTANVAIDRMPEIRAAVIETLVGYGANDLLCYRAEYPAALVERQSKAWDPLLEWAEARFAVRFIRVAGVVPHPQPAETLAALRAELARFDNFRLSALQDLVTLPGSLVIGLAAAERAFAVRALWQASRVDEEWQSERWGRDAEAEARANTRAEAFSLAARLIEACGKPS